MTDTVDRMLPLYEAKMLHHYNHRWATYEVDGSLRDTTAAELDDPAVTVEPRYWVPEASVSDALASRWARGWLAGFRKICRATDERTVVSFTFPIGGLGDSGNLLLPTDGSPALLYGNTAALVFDYTLRQKLGGSNLNFFQFEQLPILRPTAYAGDATWHPDVRLGEWLALRVLELAYTAWDMQPFARDLGDAGAPFRWDPDRRALLRAELDAAYFHLYGVERDDVDYILDTFPIVRRKDEAAHGEYRTKRLILEIYDGMAIAMETGEPYQTVLDPPPGHGARHPERA